MAAYRYEISLLVLKNISRVSVFQHLECRAKHDENRP